MNFKKCIKEIINIYNEKSIYKERNVSITRALQFYVSHNEVNNIITNKELKEIKKF